MVPVATVSEPLNEVTAVGSVLLETNNPEFAPKKILMESFGDHQMDIRSS